MQNRASRECARVCGCVVVSVCVHYVVCNVFPSIVRVAGKTRTSSEAYKNGSFVVEMKSMLDLIREGKTPQSSEQVPRASKQP